MAHPMRRCLWTSSPVVGTSPDRSRQWFGPWALKGGTMRRLLGAPGVIPVALTALALSGCSTRVERLSSVQVPGKPPGCTLQEFQTEEDVRAPFEALCDITAFDSGFYVVHGSNVDTIIEYREKELKDPEREVLVAVRRKACKCGADAIILIKGERRGAGEASVKVRAIRFAASGRLESP